MQRYFLILTLLFYQNIYAQTIDSVGPGQSMIFSGNKGSVDFGDVYNDLTFPFTFSCWLKLDPSKSNIAAIFASEEGSFPYRGFWVRMTKTNVGLGWGDGKGGNLDEYRRVKVADVPDISGKWIHFAAVAYSDSQIDLFINGIQLNSYWTGTSAFTMVNNQSDRVKLGEFFTNGQTWRMVGEIDEVRLWSYSRSLSEIRTDMCHKLHGNENGLIGYWNLNETEEGNVKDLSKTGNNGLSSAITKNYSGAPIGDASVYNYTGSFENTSISNENSTIKIIDILNNPDGIQLYKVTEKPSRFSEDYICIDKFYFGVFVAALDNKYYHVKLKVSDDVAKTVFSRTDNSISMWDKNDQVDQPFEFDNRQELLLSLQDSLDLGPDITVCPGEVKYFEVDATSLVWSDGVTGIMRSFDAEGWYSAHLEGACSDAVDSIFVSFESTESFDLGNDLDLCFNQSHTFTLDAEELLWTDGISGFTRSFNAEGWYKASIEGKCVTVSDSIYVRIPDQLTLNLGNDILCSLEYHEIKVNKDNVNYLWSDGSSGPSILINGNKSIWLKISNECETVSDTIHVQPLPDNLFVANVLTPNGDEFNPNFMIDPLLQGSTITVYNRWGKEVYFNSDYQNNWNGKNLSTGVYFYKIKNACLTKVLTGAVHLLR